MNALLRLINQLKLKVTKPSWQPSLHALLVVPAFFLLACFGFAQNSEAAAGKLTNRLESKAAEAINQVLNMARSSPNALVARSNTQLHNVALKSNQLSLNFSRELLDYRIGSLEFEEMMRRIHFAAGQVLLDEDIRNIEFSTLIDGVPLPDLLRELEAPVDAKTAAAGVPTQSANLISGRRIAISPGHGYYYTGTAWSLQRSYYFGIVEDFVNSDITAYLNTALVAAGGDSRPTRNLNKSAGNGESGFPKWQEAARYHLKAIGVDSSVWNEAGYTQIEQDIRCRPRYANSVAADILVSVHNNGGGGTGTETWYDTSNGYQVESKKLADFVHARVINAIRGSYNSTWTDRGVKGGDGTYGENRIATRPSVLIEIAFMDRQTPDNTALQSETFKSLVATAIKDGIDDYFGGTGNAPANDTCAGAVAMNAGTTYTVNTANATATGDPTPTCGSGVTKGVWYTFTPASSGTVTISTCASDFDTVLQVYTGACGSLTAVSGGCNDDNGPSCSTSRASVSFAGTSGTTYRIFTGGYGGASGNLSIVATVASPPPTPSANAATGMTSSGFTANWSSSSGATGYRLDVSTSSTFSSYVSGYQDLNAGNVLSWTVSGLSASTTYYYRVRAYNGNGTSASSGTITVATTGSAPANDTCAGAIAMTAGSTYSVNTANATSTGDPAPSCQSTMGKGVWYTFTPSISGLVTINTCASSFDTVVAVYTGTCGSLTAVSGGCNDDNGPSCTASTASVSFNGTGGTVYRILAGGFGGDSGTLSIVATVVAQLPDLTIVEPVLVSPTSVAPGGTIRVDWTEKNQGTTASAPAHNTKVFLSTSAYGTTYQVGYYGPMNTLAVGETASYSDANIVVPVSVPAGDYYVTAFVDCDQNVSEGSAEGNNIGSSTPTRLTVVTSPPSAPTVTAATSLTSSGFTANWSSSSGATGYRLDVSTSSTFASFVSGYQDLDIGNLTSKGVTGLGVNTAYYYRVRAYNTGGTSGNSGTITVTTLPNPPSAPTATVATSISSGGFTANWNSVSGVTGYRIDVSASSTFSSYVNGGQDLDLGNFTSVIVSGQSANTTYYYRVRAYNTGGTSGNSGTIIVTTLPNAPSAPTANAATSVTSNGFTANWNSSSGATGYRIDVSTSSTFSTYISGGQDVDIGNSLAAIVSGQGANATYYYRVRAYNGSGTSGNSGTITVTTLPNPPSAPTANAASSVASSGFTANWSTASGATGYRLDVSTSSTFASFVSGYQDLDVGNLVNRSVSGLNGSTIYYYRVRAYNPGGTSGNSSTITTTTLPNPPSAPTANAATSVTVSGFTANWSSASGATGYRLDVSMSSAFASFVSGYQDLDVGNVVTKAVSGLSAGTTLYYRVRAYNTGGAGGNSGTITTVTVPPSPIANAASGIATNALTANWSSTSGTTGYRLDVSTNSAFSNFVSGYLDLDVGNVLARNVTGLTAAKVYYYRVRAYNGSGTSASSATITTATGGPAIAFTKLGNNFVLSWPTNDSAFKLYYATNPATMTWISNSVSPSIVSGRYTITNSMTNKFKLYRLNK